MRRSWYLFYYSDAEMKVTSLKQQLKNPERVSVFVDGQYAFSLNLDELVKYKVKNGDEFSEADVKKFKKISEDGKLKFRALAWVLNRPHSVREFRDYMRRKKAAPDFTDKLVEEFTAKNYLNDETYGRWLAEMRGRAGKSNRAIRSELLAKGVDREVAEEVLAASAGDETARLRELIRKKQKLTRYKNDPLKLKQYLAGQGFSYDLIKRELNT